MRFLDRELGVGERWLTKGRTAHNVNSGSMEPAFYRGDLLFLTNPASERYQTGDITVYKIPGADIPIVHRVLETHDFVKNGKEKECVICCCCDVFVVLLC